MSCLAAGIDRYGYSLKKRQEDFILRRLAIPGAIARANAWLAFHNGRPS
jgi:hypothetical protein